MRRVNVFLYSALIFISAISLGAATTPGPQISGVTPKAVAKAAPQTLTVVGSGFKTGLTPSIGTASGVTSTSFMWTVTLNNAGTTTLSVTNRDTQVSNAYSMNVGAPTEPALYLMCPPPQVVTTTSSAGIAVNYPSPLRTGGVPPISMACTPPSGKVFPVGTTPVMCAAVDAAQQRAACSFAVTVNLGQTAPKLSEYAINGVPPFVGTTSMYLGTAKYSNGTSQPVQANLATWQSANTAIAAWSSPGVLKGVSAGTTVVSSIYQGMTATSTVTIPASPGPVPPPPPPPTQVNGGKTLISSGDFTFLGAFKVPSSAGGGDAAWGRTLALRTVNGQTKLLSMTAQQGVFEINIPSPLGSNPANFPVATLGRFWGDVFEARHTVQYGLASGFVYGLYWDDVDNRLYWNYGDIYKANTNPDSSIGYSTLNDADGSHVSVGSWQVGDNSKMTMGGVLPVPSWWSNLYAPGRRLAAGFGGYQSVVATGPASMGLALFGFDPAQLGATPLHGKVPSRTLVMYPYTQGCQARMARDVDYTTQFDACNPANGAGFNTWVDDMWQGAVWIDTPTKTGILVTHVEGNGQVWYQNSTTHAERGSHWMRVYSPDDFARVLAGSANPWGIQPRASWAVQFPGAFTYPLPSWQDEPAYLVTGAAYDSATQRLYVAVRFAAGPSINQVTPQNTTAIYVFQVS
jgi:HYR domain